MAFSISNDQGRHILKLEGALTIRCAQDLAAALNEGLEAGTPTRVDTEAVEDIDTCILQLLCSVRRNAFALFFDNPSDVFVSAVDRCGLRRELLSSREGS